MHQPHFCDAALAHERDPAQDKCTMLNPNAARHLRGATGGQQPALQSVSTDNNAAGMETATPGTPLGSEEGPQQADWGWRHHRQQRQRPTGRSTHVNSQKRAFSCCMHYHNILPDASHVYFALCFLSRVCQAAVQASCSRCPCATQAGGYTSTSPVMV